jgi:hypothetical protein
MSPNRHALWCLRCSGRTHQPTSSSRISGAIATDTVHIVEDDGRKFLAYYERDGAVAGVVGGGMPGKVMKARAKIAAAVPISEVLG